MSIIRHRRGDTCTVKVLATVIFFSLFLPSFLSSVLFRVVIGITTTCHETQLNASCSVTCSLMLSDVRPSVCPSLAVCLTASQFASVQSDATMWQQALVVKGNGMVTGIHYLRGGKLC